MTTTKRRKTDKAAIKGETATENQEARGRKRETTKGTITDMRLKASLLAALLLTLAAGCSRRPVLDYSYVTMDRIKGWNDNTPVELEFDMVDTIGASELYIAGEIATKRTLDKKRGYPINITLVAPNGTGYTDTLLLPLHVKEGGKVSSTSHGIKEVVWPYRKNIYNKIPGRWKMVITKGDTTADYTDILGLGVHCKQDRI